MALEAESTFDKKGRESIWIFDHNDPKSKHRAYLIDQKAKRITYFPRKVYYLKKLTVLGFTKLPPEFNENKGYVKSGAFYYIDKKAKEIKAKNVILDNSNSSKIDKRNNCITINYQDFRSFRRQLSIINSDHKRNKSNFVDRYYFDLFPGHFTKKTIYTKSSVETVINSLNKSLIDKMKSDEIGRVLDFFEQLLSSKYKSTIRKRNLFKSTKLKVDSIAITKIVEEYERLLKNKVSEDKWGKYLKSNLFLLDSKYIKAIPQLNVVLASARKVDFGLVDTNGYLDIFEIKKPNTILLAKNTDRGNYYWSTNAIKALVQAEKYLYNAEKKALALVQDILSEKDIVVDIVRPKAIVLMGSNRQLIKKKQKDDFQVLRRSLKNIEIVLYDELLDRIKAQKDRTYTA